jgi:hypothetical protein
MRNDLFCYECNKPSPAYTCPHCGGTDVEPFDTDTGMAEDDGRETERRNDAWAERHYRD